MNTPICQSCGMPLAHESDYGTDVRGAHVQDYCRFCFTHGAFKEPAATQGSMIDLTARILAERGMDDHEARVLMARTIPTLKRWRAA